MISALIKLAALTFILLFVAWVIPGIKISDIQTAIIASIVIAAINTFVKPVLMFLTLPINIITLGISILFINAALFLFVAYLVPGVSIENFHSAFFGALLLSVLSIGISWL